MHQPLQHSIRHRTGYRTRLHVPALKGQPEVCRQLQRSLIRLDGVQEIQVRARTGSIILLHPNCRLGLSPVLSLVASFLEQAVSREFPPRMECGCLAAPARRQERSAHVPGFVLFVSGLYLLYLYAKRMLLVALGPGLPATARILSLPALVTLAISLPIQQQAVENLRRSGRPDMGLISTGILYFSLFTGNTLAALTVFWLFNLSSWLEDRIRIRTRQAVRDMLSRDCRQAWLLRDGLELEVEAADLQPGDVIILRKGNAIPADGLILSGQALVDEAALTGEDAPVSRSVDEVVLAGTVMVDGTLQVRVEHAGEATRLAAIIRLIEQAECDPGELQLSTRRFSQAMVPVSLGLAGVALLFTGNLMQAMAVLIITCPCALRLSTSVAVSSAMSSAARSGILIKGGRYVEVAGQVNVLVVDKTGTLTDRSAEVSGLRIIDRRFRETTVIRLAASVQQAWSHPLSRALVAQAGSRQISLLPVEVPEFIVGQGVRGIVGQHAVVIGNAAFLEDNAIPVECLGDVAADENQVLIACDGRLIATMGIRQRNREGTGEALARLRQMGVKRLVLLTGDNQVGLGQGIEQAFDEILVCQSPEAKAVWVNSWKRKHPQDVVAMVGDGINDTPAFAAADLSLAIGQGGADVTVEYADIVLKRGGLDQAAEALALGRQTLETIRGSYAIALGMNGSILALTTFGWLSPVGGALLHNLTTVLAVANASTLIRSRRQHQKKDCTRTR